MITHPRLASRVSVLERRQNTLEALIEELSEDVTARFTQVDTRIEGLSKDMTASFKQLVEYHIQTERQLDTRFNQVDARFDKVEATIKTEIASVKNDMTAMENRILDAFKQVITVVNPQRPPSE